MRCCSSKSPAVIPLFCLFLIAFFCVSLQATPIFPWETENSVRNALAQQVGANVVCEGVVDKIAARSNPAYFVLRDSFAANGDTQISKIVVLFRPPISLFSGQRIYVGGVLQSLPGSSELCIYNPTVYGYFKDGSGNATWSVMRSTQGKVTITAYENMSCDIQAKKSLDIWFSDTTPDDWPMFMHDPQHTGMSKTWDDSGETLTRVWVKDLPTAQNNVRIGSDDLVCKVNGIHHPEPSGSTIIFSHPYIDSSPVVKGNIVIVGGLGQRRLFIELGQPESI